jgi:hypothetical protein
VPARDLRRALAEADHRRLIDLDEVEAIAGHGLRGGTALRSALASAPSACSRSASSRTARRMRSRRPRSTPPSAGGDGRRALA